MIKRVSPAVTGALFTEVSARVSYPLRPRADTYVTPRADGEEERGVVLFLNITLDETLRYSR